MAKTKKTIAEKADQFISYAKINAVGTWKPLKENSPHLIEAIKIPGQDKPTLEEMTNQWDFFYITAMAWWTLTQAKVDLEKNDAEVAFGVICENLESWDSNAFGAFMDLDEFTRKYDDEIEKITDPKEAINLMKLVVGTWFIWNITCKAPIEDEGQLAGTLGHLIHLQTYEYWTWTP